jgi:hypothetical protein
LVVINNQAPHRAARNQGAPVRLGTLSKRTAREDNLSHTRARAELFDSARSSSTPKKSIAVLPCENPLNLRRHVSFQ